MGQLFHLTQRNTHAYAEYDRLAFNRRQTILLASEDVGMMGLNLAQYQKQKRVHYVISGTLDQPGTLLQQPGPAHRRAQHERGDAAQVKGMFHN